jgi:fructan beta-fructosidase
LIAAILVSFHLLAASLVAADRPDRLLADFEDDTYGDWKVVGAAFGERPARGALPGQMGVSGYEGNGLVNSFAGGDSTTGKLTSPEFTIDRAYINFLIGGGAHAGKTCINLVVEGRPLRTATGPNDRAGGSEQLDWHSWDVTDLAGQTAMLEIVDDHTGGWGHINVDQIILGDKKRATGPARREITVTGRYLHLPVKTGATMRRMRFLQNGKTIREFEIELAEGDADFSTFADVGDFAGETIAIEVDRLPSDSQALEGIAVSDELPEGVGDYEEPRRPQFHFTSRRGWLNDPNGLVFANGEYHLYYQHNPYGWNWGNMHWGHAVSSDLVSWKELPEALYPREFGDWCFSGSAVRLDKDPASKRIAAFFTSTGRGECVLFSDDGGRTFREYEGNPVVKHTGRDPKVIWHEPTKRWCMAVYNEDAGQRIAFYSSADLKEWKYESAIDGFFECPDLFALPVEASDEAVTREQWVLYAADGKYVLGDFDGHSFTPKTEKQELWRGDFYAAQTFDGLPYGRRVQIGWGRGITFPGEAFNQQMTIACDLSLREIDGQVKMCAIPVRELAALREKATILTDVKLSPSANPLADLRGDLWDIEATFTRSTIEGAARVRLDLLGAEVEYDFAKQTVRCQEITAPLAPEGDSIRLRILVDRGSVEVFAGDGQVAISKGFMPSSAESPLSIQAIEGEVVAKKLDVHSLRSIWKPASR